MLRNAAIKAMWLGRTTAAVIGLAIALTLVLGVATTALAALPGDPFRLGQTNGIDAMSTLVGNVAGPMFRIDNNSTGAGATALDLRVEARKPPMKVNSTTKVANLNADSLDNKDSTALGITMKTNSEVVDSCTNARTDGSYEGKCAPVTVTVPAGKQYHVTVLSSFSIEIHSTGSVTYCPHVEGLSGSRSATCVSWEGVSEKISLAANYGESAASSGEIGPLGAGTYTFSTFLHATDFVDISPVYQAHTTVMVRDVSAPGPPIK